MKIRLDKIKKSLQGTTILDDLSLEMTQGHILVIVGPSGAGKSTLLRLIAGLDVPDSGLIEVDGEPIPKAESALLKYRQSVGMSFQMYNLFPHLSALENVMLPLIRVHKYKKEAAKVKAYEVLERFGLKDHALKMPAELSGGQKQRVGLVRSIAVQPKLFLFDEPTSALDPEMTAEVLDAIGELKREDKDFILITHHLGFAKRVADRIAYLENGKILEYAPTDLFFKSPQTDAAKKFLAKVLKY
jgi:polar amino acid transport system ATP-binding protein